MKTIEANEFDLSDSLHSQLERAFLTGFKQATNEHIANAEKRERVMAAVARVAQKAVNEGRHAVILGDFNTSYEVGKKGELPEDCVLSDFSCEKAPFPAAACVSGDGYDDTFAILEYGYAAKTKWNVLSKELPRTYTDTSFANAAIDHIAVPQTSTSRFSVAERIGATFGSDHYPVTVTFSD